MDGEAAKQEVLRLQALAEQTQQELQQATRMTATEETSSWEAICAHVLPTFSPETLLAASRVVDLDARALVKAHDDAVAGLKEARLEAADQILDDADFERFDRHKLAVERRQGEARARLKALRQIPGFLDRLEEQKKGKVLKGEPLERANEHATLLKDAAALDAEWTRVANIAARHRKARIRLVELEQQLKALDDDALAGARRAVADGFYALAADVEDRAGADDVLRKRLHRARGLRARHWLLQRLTQELTAPLSTLAKLSERAASSVAFVQSVTLPAEVAVSAKDVDAAFVRVRAVVARAAAFDAFDDVVATDAAGFWRAMGYEPLPQAPAADRPTVAEGAGRGVDVDVNAALVEATVQETMVTPQAFTASSTGVFITVGQPRARPLIEPPRVFGRGSRVGRYVVEGLIGKGGMAEVWLAWQEGHGAFKKRVVLKRMINELRGHKELDLMFAREAEIAARLQHPNLVQVFDYQSVDDEVFIVMEHLEGMSLHKLARPLLESGQPPPIPVVLRLIADAARGLHAAHTQTDDDGKALRLVHRDISPDNLFLTTPGFTKVLDFGIAKRDDLTTLTGKNELKGKIPYMSPEQIQSEDLDHRSDLFSLGATLYWLLAGQRPFAGHNEVSTLHAVLTKAPPRLDSFRRDVPAAVQALVDALLEKRRDDRPKDAAAVARRCEEAGAASHDDAAALLATVL